MAYVTPMENARMWLYTADAALKKRIYSTALYSMEMSVEIALKAVLLEFGVDVPKVHNIMNSLRQIFREKRALLPKEFVEKEGIILDTFNGLLELRPLAGYAFETHAGVADSEGVAGKYMKDSTEVVNLCGAAVKHIGKKKG
ncbi:MAG: HEPN domain-containing protein [Candidatus Marsarchaeota archaeon]|nr:HEPN domain-containing protein [Candidatus Marsarchaeota archaeon]